MATEILIIGGGPAGLSAAINARARGKSVLVVGNPPEENPLWQAKKVDNYPGLPGVTGAELLQAFRAHAEQSGASFLTGKALNTAYTGGRWYVSVGSDVQEAQAVILAAGIVRGKKFPGEEEFLGRGVSYCATCDGMLYRGRQTAVLGWTASAAQEADFLRGIGCTVRYFEKPRTCVIEGGAAVERVTVDGETVPVDGVFLLRPTAAPTELFSGIRVENGFVQTEPDLSVGLPGVFAAGDCTGGPLQVAKAVGEGLLAGQRAALWLDKQTRETK
jgi:thioredoxin reductase (NADPH)